MGESSHRSTEKVDREPDAESTLVPSERSTHSPERRQGQGQEDEHQRRRGHYRGITFDDILPPHLIANAPPPGTEQKQGRKRPKSTELPPTTDITTSEPPRSSTKRSYPSLKHSGSGGKSRLQATARALVRRLTVAPKRERESRRRSGYDPV